MGSGKLPTTGHAIIQASWNWPFDRKDTEVYGTKGILVANKLKKMRYVKGDRFGEEGMIDLNPLPHEVSNVFPYLSAVVQGRIKPNKDLSSFAINQVVVEILQAARESAKTGKSLHGIGENKITFCDCWTFKPSVYLRCDGAKIKYQIVV